MTTKETAELVRFILAAYPSQRQRMDADDAKAMVAAYQAGLGDLEMSIVKQAAIRALRTSKFIPSVAEIREAIGVVAHGARRTGLEAWAEVMRKVGSKGRDRVPGVDFDFDDSITAGLVPPAVWREICQSENIAADRARFIEAYDAAQARERREAQASDGATSKSLPAVAHEGVAQLVGGLAAKLTEGSR